MLAPPTILEPHDIVFAGGVDEVVFAIEELVVAVKDVVFVEVIDVDIGKTCDDVNVEVIGSDVDNKVDIESGIEVEDRVVKESLCCIEELVKVDDIDVEGPEVRFVDEAAVQIRPIFDEPRSTVSTNREQSKKQLP